MAAEFSDILATLQKRLQEFTRTIPGVQRSMYDAITAEINRLELFTDGKVKSSVKNMNILNSIRNKINRVVLTPEYRNSVKNFAGSFNEITRMQNDYWRSVEDKFKPTPLLREIRKAAITDTVNKLADAGIGANVSAPIIEILRTNITTGGSYKELAAQLRDGLLNTEQKGYLDRYAGQVATDSINQYNAQYSQTVSSDLGYTWFKYDNTDIETTRPFCDHMTDQPFFHISQVPAMLEGKTTTGQVPIYDKTKLPHGMIPGTNAENFFTRRGGYNCGHQIRPVNDRIVPADIRAAVYASPEYQLWAQKTGAPKAPPPPPMPQKPAAKQQVQQAQQQQQKQPTKPAEFKPVTSKAEGKTQLAAAFSQKANMPIGKITISSDLSLNQLNKRMAAINSLIDEYFSIADHGGATQPVDIKFKSTARAYGVVTRAVNKYTGEMYHLTEMNFGDQTDGTGSRGFKAFDKSVGVQLRGKSRVDDDKIDIATTVHEYAHVISTIRDLKLKGVPVKVKEFWDKMTDLRQEYISTMLGYNKAGEFEKLHNYHLGQYASENINEFMAEAFTEYKLSSNPSPMAKKVGKLIDEYFKR